MKSFDLSDTSSVVLLLSEGAIHTSARSKRYLRMLNLDSGKALHSECIKVWQHYGEVIKNRKKCIMDIVLHYTIKEGIKQVVIFGSGMDALSVETVSRVRDVVVYDVDYQQMKLKEKIIRQAGITQAEIKRVSSDLGDAKKVLWCLRDNMWDNTKPSILVLEGISYFLNKRSLWDLIAKFKTPDRRNVLLLEYMVPYEDITKSRQNIPERVFDIIQRYHGLGMRRIARYGANDVKARLEKMGGRPIRRYRMNQIEKTRRGGNVFFTTPKSGWIEVYQAAI